jgi:hypothetical protein
MKYYQMSIWAADYPALIKLELKYAQILGKKVSHAEFMHYIIERKGEKLCKKELE